MLIGPGLTRFFYNEKKPGFIASTVLTTVAATVMTLPITLYYFGQVSLISVVANLLILPTLPLAMGLTFLAGVSLGVPFVGMAIGLMAEKLLGFHILVVQWFAEMEQFLIRIDKYNPWVFLIYLGIAVMWVGVVVWRMVMKRKVL